MFATLQAGILALLNSAFFTATLAPEKLQVNQPTTRKALSQALNSKGAAILVDSPKVERSPGAGKNVKVLVELPVYCNPETSGLASTGCQTDAPSICVEAWDCLDGKTPDGLAAPIRVTGMEEVDSGEGLDIWKLSVELYTTVSAVHALAVSATDTLAADSTTEISD